MTEEAAGKPHPLEINYPTDVKSTQARKAYKHRFLKENPETLTADYTLTEHKQVLTNLLLHTEHPDSWHRALCARYQRHKKRGICSGRQIVIESEETERNALTINVYHNGTVMFQGSEASLGSVQQDFNFIKELAETETQRVTAAGEGERSSSEAQGSGEGGEQTHSPEQSEAQDSTAQHSQLQSTVLQLRESLSLQEVELVEIKQLLLANPPCSDTSQQLKHQLDLLEDSVLQMRKEVQELQQDRESLRKELTTVREQLLLRDKTVNFLREELQSLRHPTEKQPTHSEPEQTHTEPGPAHSGPAHHLTAHSESQPMHSKTTASHSSQGPNLLEPTPIHSEPRTTHPDTQPTHSDPQSIHSDPQPIHSEPQPALSESQPACSKLGPQKETKNTNTHTCSH